MQPLRAPSGARPPYLPPLRAPSGARPPPLPPQRAPSGTRPTLLAAATGTEWGPAGPHSYTFCLLSRQVSVRVFNCSLPLLVHFSRLGRRNENLVRRCVGGAAAAPPSRPRRRRPATDRPVAFAAPNGWRGCTLRRLAETLIAVGGPDAPVDVSDDHLASKLVRRRVLQHQKVVRKL